MCGGGYADDGETDGGRRKREEERRGKTARADGQRPEHAGPLLKGCGRADAGRNARENGERAKKLAEFRRRAFGDSRKRKRRAQAPAPPAAGPAASREPAGRQAPAPDCCELTVAKFVLISSQSN